MRRKRVKTPIRVPVAKPSRRQKSIRDYDRKKNKKEIDKESER